MAHPYASAACREAALSVRDLCKGRQLPDPWYKFIQQIKGADRRGIEWKLTFEDWWEIWEPHYAERGNQKMQKVMCRHLDRGAYEKGNVRIDLACNNLHEKKLSGYMRWGMGNYGYVTSADPTYVDEMYGKDPLELLIAAEEEAE
jgi:hypothetical protein